MAVIRVQIKNLGSLKSAFAKAPIIVTKKLNIAIKASILAIAAESAKNAPVRTGNLRASHFIPESLDFKNLYGKLQPSPFYAIYVHDGTKFMKARPFMQSAVDDKQGDVDAYFNQALEESLQEIANGAK